MTTVARAAHLSVVIEPIEAGWRVTVGCPCHVVGAVAVRDVAVSDVIDELRARHRQQAPACVHRERRRPE